MHFRWAFRFLCHLLKQEILVIFIDFIYSVLQSLFLLLIVLFVSLPHSCLLINIWLLIMLSLPLILHLLSQELSHILLVLLQSMKSLLFHYSLPHLLFIFIPGNHIIFKFLPLFYFMKHIIRHLIHEFLSSGFSLLHFSYSILLLFLQHSRVLILSF